MKTSVAAALAGLAMASTPTLGADLFGSAPPPMTYPSDRSPLAEVGTNWYLRGDLGVSVDQAPSYSMAAISMPPAGPGVLPFSSTLGSSKWREDVTADIGVGYRFNNWLRFEGTYEYRTGPAGHNVNSVVCPSFTATPNGYLYDTSSTCTGNAYLHQRNSTLLASAYVDLGDYWGITPYVGAGAGLNASMVNGSVGYIDGSGNPYSATFTPGTTPDVWVDSGGFVLPTQPNIGFTNQNWNHAINQTHYSMAWALMAGVGIQLSPSMTLDISYRYLNAGATNVVVTPQTGATVKLQDVSQDLRVGIRLMAN